MFFSLLFCLALIFNALEFYFVSFLQSPLKTFFLSLTLRLPLFASLLKAFVFFSRQNAPNSALTNNYDIVAVAVA